jgi:hypothetical protein
LFLSSVYFSFLFHSKSQNIQELILSLFRLSLSISYTFLLSFSLLTGIYCFLLPLARVHVNV